MVLKNHCPLNTRASHPASYGIIFRGHTRTGLFTILCVQFCMYNVIFDVGCGMWDV